MRLQRYCLRLPLLLQHCWARSSVGSVPALGQDWHSSGL